jgi:hypothetical protein
MIPIPKNPPQVIIPLNIWTPILNEAEEFEKTRRPKAFGLFTSRRQGKRRRPDCIGADYYVKESKEIELKEIKPGFYLYQKQKEKGFYPKSGLRYAGAVEIRDDTNLRSFDAYWLGRELIDFIIFLNSPTICSAHWVNIKTGEFFEIQPTIVENTFSWKNAPTASHR